MIRQNINAIKKELDTIKLVVVSKYRSIEELQEVYESGHLIMGENRVQELINKQEILPKDIQWHMIGHLQKNKVKYIAPFISLIHSVDSERLLKEINKQAAKNERTIEILLQVHIAEEETKFGFNKEELIEFIKSTDWRDYNNIKVVGLMAMATNTSDQNQIENEFISLKNLQMQLNKMSLPNQIVLKELSMGMSSDYKIAIKCGSTMVRIGSKIFS